MAIPKEAYRELEGVVGKNNISDDPAVLDCYRYPLSHTAIHIGPYYRVYTPRGAAVLLPGSVEEVQGIVKVCNKYKVRFKPSSTFWSAWGFPLEDDTIQLDMRRMDRILEIDDKNNYAVVEPHVIGATLQAEAMKVGLNTHIHGPGASCSCLASATALGGLGPDTLYMGHHNENLLGVEWVMPDGEILRVGSVGSGLDWFCCDGPGPSLKGLVRGMTGTNGAMGVFTKCAIKLYPWPGPAPLPVEGRPPAYKANLPDNIRVYTLGFPSWKAWADACYLIFDAGIGYVAHRQFNMFGRDLKGAMVQILSDPTKTLGDIEELLEDPEIQQMTEDMKRDFQLVLAGMTPGDIEWQDNALDNILKTTGGWKVKGMLEPDRYNWSLLYMLRLGHKNLNLVYGGGYDGAFGLGGTPDFGTSEEPARVEQVTAFKREWEKKGNVVAAGGDGMMGGIGGMGGGGHALWENFTHFDPADKASTEGTLAFFNAATKLGMEKGWGPGMEKMNDYARWTDGYTTPPDIRNRILEAAAQPEAFRYQRKFKETFNPNDLGDGYYRTLDDPK
ncbi:MAG: FAD-binding oxidoreductase [Dehalococcoidales bacterium]|nr:FAD-binding oxidoreductase [Dehalococcoidales bacterium]